MKVLIFGNGYLGNTYHSSGFFKNSVLSLARIDAAHSITSEIETHRPDVVINCAGKTNLEWCRDNREEAERAHITGPLLLLEACRAKGIVLVHIGSGCIFEGVGPSEQGFSEEDAPNPQCFYAETKARADELLMKEAYGNLLILRIRQPFSNKPHPRNLITKLLSYEKLITSQNSMTSVDDLVEATRFLLERGECGIFNVCNTGTISPHEIVLLAKKIAGVKKEFVPISKEELDQLDRAQKREKRVDTIINTGKLLRTGFKMSSVHDRIREAFAMGRI